jgi:hypothetical protein
MGAAAADRRWGSPNCGSPNGANRAENVVLIPAQSGRTLGWSVAFRGVYDDGPFSDGALPYFA